MTADTLAALPRWRAFVALGGNQGDVPATFVAALAAMAALPATSVEAMSSLYRTRPFEAEGPDFVNAVVALQCGLGPQELMSALLGIEQAHGRTRAHHHAPRTLDLDLLWFGDAQRHTAALTLPHPRMMGRAFVLTPLSELMQGLASAGLAGEPASVVGPGLPATGDCACLAAEQGVQMLGPWPGEKA